jgi:amidase
MTLSDELRWWSAVDTATAVKAGHLRASEVLEAAIERIEQIDPLLGSVVIVLFDRARENVIDAPNGGGGFHGVPLLLKDVGEELEGTSNWCGTRGLANQGYRSSSTTQLAHRFEDLGFSIVGKSACPELSASSTTEPEGFAPTRNPWDLGRTVGGSSGGAAAAVAAGLVPIAHGSDGTGSLRFPAAHCGVATLKPSRGRIPITPPTGQSDPLHAWTQFALARDVNDLAALFPALAYETSIRTEVPHQLRVGLLDHDPIIGLPLSRDCRDAVHQLGEHLTSMGHEVEMAFPASLTTLIKPYLEAWSTVGPTVRREQVEWLSQRLGRPCRAGDLSDDILDLAKRADRIDPAAVGAAYDSIAAAMAPIPTWWDGGFDLLVTPVTLQPAWMLGEDAPIRTGMFCAPFSFTGQPALIVPVLWNDHGIPVGAQIIGRHGSDEALLALGGELQTAIGWLERRPPVLDVG